MQRKRCRCRKKAVNADQQHIAENVGKNKYVPNINHEGNKRFVKDIEPGTLLGYKYFSFRGSVQIKVTSRGSGGAVYVMTNPGQPLAEFRLKASKDWEASDTAVFCAQGDLPLYLCCRGKGNIDLLDFTLLDGEPQ